MAPPQRPSTLPEVFVGGLHLLESFFRFGRVLVVLFPVWMPLQGELLQQALRPAERAYLQQRTPPSLAQHEVALGLRKQEATALGPAARPGRPAITLNGRPLPCWIAPYGSSAANSSDACKPGRSSPKSAALGTMAAKKAAKKAAAEQAEAKQKTKKTKARARVAF